MKAINMISSDKITFQVFQAIEDKQYVPINKKISLEYLSADMDGIFENEKSWRSFINGNFVSEYDRTCWRDNVKESTIKKWAHAEKEYKHLFVVNIGKDKYISVAPEDIKLDFDYKIYYNNSSSFPSSVELFVTATIKKESE